MKLEVVLAVSVILILHMLHVAPLLVEVVEYSLKPNCTILGMVLGLSILLPSPQLITHVHLVCTHAVLGGSGVARFANMQLVRSTHA